MPEPRPRLIPIQAQWEIEIFDPHLTLVVSETPAESTEMIFYAKVLNPTEPAAFEHHVIKLTFREARAGRLIPGENDMPFDPLAYDQSAVPSAEGFWKNPSEFERQWEEDWKRTGVSPDSRFYQVLPSPWIEELRLDEPDLRHFLAVGRHAAAEVLAKNWQWLTVELRGQCPPPPWHPEIGTRD